LIRVGIHGSGILGQSGRKGIYWVIETLRGGRRRWAKFHSKMRDLLTSVQPGTYDALSHMLFTPSPTAGSSGGPIVDEVSGAVVGMMLGSRQDDRVHGVRGWGIPSEIIYEVRCIFTGYTPKLSTERRCLPFQDWKGRSRGFDRTHSRRE